MSNQRAVIELIKQLSGQANILTIPRIYIQITGDIKAALFLSQCVYWSDKSTREDGFFYKTYEEWEEETGLTRHEIARIRETLADLVEVKILRANSAPTQHFRVRFDALYESICRFSENRISRKSEKRQSDLPESGKSDLPESGKTLTKITTEITQETTPPAPPAPPKPPLQSSVPIQDLEYALAEVCNLDYRLNIGDCRENARKLFNQGYTSAQIRQFFGREGPWWDIWPGSEGEYPTIRKVKETIRGFATGDYKRESRQKTVDNRVQIGPNGEPLT